MKQYLFGLFLLVCPAIWAQQESSSISEAMDNYDYETAIELIDREQPTVNLLFLKSKALRGLLKYNEAARCLQDIITQNPENKQALIELADNYRIAGRHTEALKYYDQALLTDSTNKYIELQRVNLLARMEKHNDVIETCTRILQTDSLPHILRLAAQSYDALLNDTQAILHYEKALEKDPYDYVSASNLALLHIIADPQMAIDITEKYRELDPANLSVNRVNAQAYCILTEYETAIKRYDYLIENGDVSKLTSYYYGMCNYHLEDYEKAYQYLFIAFLFDQANVNIIYYLGRSALHIKRVKEGIEYFVKALELTIPADEELAKIYGALAQGYGLDKDRNNQIEALKEQRKYDPNNHLILYRIGTVYHDFLNDTKNAERYFDMFMKTMPKEMNIAEDTTRTIRYKPIAEKREMVDYYRYAEQRLEEIRVEKFFKEGVKE